MPFNLTGASATFNASGKFGYSFNGGTASYATNLIPTSGSFALSMWVKTGITGSVQICAGSVGTFWMGKNASNKAELHYGNAGTEVTLTSTVTITDNAWHLLEWDYDATTGGTFFVDGVLASSSATLMAAAGATYANGFGVRTFLGAGSTYDWNGEVDEGGLFTAVQHTTNYTPPTSPISNGAANLKALWHFDNDLLDSAGSGINVNLTGVGMTMGVGTVTIPSAQPGVGMTMGVGSVSTSINALNTSLVLFSPYNWNVVSNTAKTINAGAYFKTIFGGNNCTLQFDMTGILTPLPEIWYRIDGYGPWTAVNIAASIVLTVPTDTSDFAAAPGHYLEVVVKSMTETQNRWNPQSTAVKLTGILLDSGSSLTLPASRVLNGLYYGDSITEGVRTVNSTATNDTDRNDANMGWSLLSAKLLDAEMGNVGFGATGFLTAGSGGVPALTTSYNLLYSGVSRVFTPAPDYIVINEGTNDSGDVTTACTTVLNGLLAATPAATIIFVLLPFNGTHASQLQAAIAACNAPSRCVYVDTTGFFNTSYSTDGLHPNGVANENFIAPKLSAAQRPYLVTASIRPTATKNVTKTFQTPGGVLQAGIAGEWEWQDVRGITCDKGAGTTDGSGVLSITVHTNLVSAGIGYLKFTNTTGSINTTYVSFYGPVAVT